MSNRIPRKENCHDLVEFVHQRNMVCSMALLQALKTAHPELCAEEETAAVIEPEPVPEPVVLPPIPNELLAAAHEAGPNPLVTVRDIQNFVCKEFGISHADMLSQRRKQKVVVPRHVAVYLSKKMTVASLPAIGRRFGGRDHTTALSSVRRVEGLMRTMPELAARIRKLEVAIDQRFSRHDVE